jgi:hypothetical protein
MSSNYGAAGNGDILLDNFAAELTRAAYSVALKHGMTGSWIKVELDLWRGLAETVKKWAWEWPPAGSSDEFEVWRNGLLEDLTESAFYVAVKHGIKGSLLEVELCLYRVFRLAIRRVGQEALQCRMTIVRYS